MITLQLSYYAATQDFLLNEVSCGEALRQAAAKNPTAIALIDADGSKNLRSAWTYADLLKESKRVAHALTTEFAAGTHVAVWGANCPQWVFVQFGIALSGMVMVTVNPALKVGELAYVLKQSRAQAIFHAAEFRGNDLAAAIQSVCRTESLRLAKVVCFDELDSFTSVNEMSGELPCVLPAAPAMIQYTSGTTGQPKGALLNHHSITNNARIMAKIKSLNAATVNLAVAPLFHTAGCVANVLGTIQTGGTLLLPSAFSAESMLDLIEQEMVTYTFAVPTMLIALLTEQARQPRDLSSLEIVFSGAATVPVDIVRRVEEEFDVRLIIGYGQTETSPAITHTRLDDLPIDKSETIGRAIPQVEIKIVDPESGETLPVDQPGELCTRGFLVMMGYFDMPDASAETIDREGWLHTGDLCSMDARGYCRIIGRLKDLIIRGGENIYPREIEELLITHDAIVEVAVIGIPDEYWGESVGAVLRLAPQKRVDRVGLSQFVGQTIAHHKVPQHWFVLDEIPATASGKLQKFRLVELYRSGGLEGARIE